MLMQLSLTQKVYVQYSCNSQLLRNSLSSIFMQFSTTWEPVKFNAQAILTCWFNPWSNAHAIITSHGGPQYIAHAIITYHPGP